MEEGELLVWVQGEVQRKETARAASREPVLHRQAGMKSSSKYIKKGEVFLWMQQSNVTAEAEETHSISGLINTG